ncbi:MAG: hypothetical protein ACTSU2_09750 [Promethearchaeota archaeon]
MSAKKNPNFVQKNIHNELDKKLNDLKEVLKSSMKNSRYIGPRALFDPYFVPDRLFDRSKEVASLKKFILDAVRDRFTTSISIYGIKGSGKTVLANKSLYEIKELIPADIRGAHHSSTGMAQLNMQVVRGNPINIKKSPKISASNQHGQKEGFQIQSDLINLGDTEFSTIYVDCENKDTEQVIFSMVNALASAQNYNMDPSTVLNLNKSGLWNLFKHLLDKNPRPILCFMDSVEYMNPKLLNKFCSPNISHSIILLNTFNLHRSSPFLMNFNKSDFNINLYSYRHTTLYEIGKDRCEVAFRNPIDDEIIKFITDLSSEFDKPVPGSSIRVLREVYPIIAQNNSIDGGLLRDACRYNFEGFSLDEISIADYIAESDMVDRVFIDNISTYFNKTQNYYIDFNELEESYKVACESLEYDFSQRKFMSSLAGLKSLGLILPSKIDLERIKTMNTRVKGQNIGANKVFGNEINMENNGNGGMMAKRNKNNKYIGGDSAKAGSMSPYSKINENREMKYGARAEDDFDDYEIYEDEEGVEEYWDIEDYSDMGTDELDDYQIKYYNSLTRLKPSYYLTIAPQFLSQILDVAFGQF